MITTGIAAARRRRTAAVLTCVAAVAALTGCGRTVEGRAVQEGAGGAGASAEFTKLLTECDAVTDEQIAQSVGSDYVLRGFFGAICRWDGDGPTGPVKVTFNWFETGALDIEREAGERLGYAVENTTVEGRRAIQMRRPADPDSCGVSANASTAGIFGWWVQYAPGSGHPDPCEAAATLVRLTLNLSS